MSLLSRLSVSAKLLALVALALAALAGVAGSGLLAVWRTNDTVASVVDHELEAVKAVGRARGAVGNLRRYEKDVFLNMGSDDVVADYLKKWRTEASGIETEMRAALAILGDDDRARVNAMLVGLQAYRRAFEAIVKDIEIGKIHDPWEASKALLPAKKDVRAMDTAMDGLVASIDARTRSLRDETGRRAGRELAIVAAALAAAAALLGATGWRIARSITRPLGTASEVLRRVAHGDLTRAVATEGRDELAAMIRSVGEMQQSLSHEVAAIRDGAQGVAEASHHVARGGRDLSARTEQGARQLQRAAESLDRIAATLHASAETAVRARRLADDTSAAAHDGNQVVGRVVTTMDEIGRQSERIAEISGVIDGIAFQTNILALNAAVEAARAGEEGRGFAVVASEVRSLAQRSAVAAREIKALIAGSVERAEDGRQLVANAGRTMSRILGHVADVGSLIGRISDATQEQSVVVADVNRSVAALGQAKRQDVQLVEQSAAAAAELLELASRLSASTARFRLQGSPPDDPAMQEHRMPELAPLEGAVPSIA